MKLRDGIKKKQIKHGEFIIILKITVRTTQDDRHYEETKKKLIKIK